MDCFAGSGTTLAVASQNNRRWIGVDKSDEAIKTILKQLEHGTEPMGDFVNDRRPKNLTLPLYDPVADFTLYIDEATQKKQMRSKTVEASEAHAVMLVE